MPWVQLMSIKKKIKRKRKKKAEKELKEKVMSFDRMPDCCVMCYKVFDKTSKEDHDTWIVVERREKKRVSLFCPNCWNNGIAAVKEEVVNKQTELDKFFLEQEDPKKRAKKIAPSPKDYPQVSDYVVEALPSIGEEDE